MSLHDLTAETIDHEPQPLAAYKGQVVLAVNTASECGATPQYAGLEELWRAYKGRGLEVLGFPSNDFGAQEPGTEAQIKTFCDVNYKVSFPLFAKVSTTGAAPPEGKPAEGGGAGGRALRAGRAPKVRATAAIALSTVMSPTTTTSMGPEPSRPI